MPEIFGLDEYLLGCRKFAEKAVEIGFVRYEDFTASHDKYLQIICNQLKIPFDPMYKERWANYPYVTGDKKGMRSKTEIRKLERRPIEQDLLEKIEHNPDYLRTIELLGYSD